MSSDDPSLAATKAIAERIHLILQARQIDCVVIGAMAMAVHHYSRATEDFDLAIAVPPFRLDELDREFRALGWVTELRMPDGNDPLGGVIDIHVPGAELVQLVNFDNSPAGGFPRLVREASANAVPLERGSPLRVTDLGTLIAFKLYAGGAKSQLDILELLDRNPELDLDALMARCKSMRLSTKFRRVLAARKALR